MRAKAATWVIGAAALLALLGGGGGMAAAHEPLLGDGSRPLAEESHGELIARLEGDTCNKTKVFRTVQDARLVELVFEARITSGEYAVRIVSPDGHQWKGSVVDGRLVVSTGALPVRSGKPGDVAPASGDWRVVMKGSEASGNWTIRFRGVAPRNSWAAGDGAAR